MRHRLGEVVKVKTAEKIEYALRYASLGWKVWWANYPIGFGDSAKCSCRNPDHVGRSAGKHPIGHDWAQSATDKPDVIRSLFSQREDANISIITGAVSRIFVLDLDGQKGIAALIRLIKKHEGRDIEPKNICDAFNTVVFITGSGGYHFIFNHPGYRVSNKVRIEEGIDVRGEGGQIIAPPSLHWSKDTDKDNPNANSPYNLCKNHGPLGFEDMEPGCVPVADAPAWLLGFISSNNVHEKEENSETFFNFSQIKGVSEGKRDYLLFQLVRKAKMLSLPIEFAREQAIKFAETCDPPYSVKLAEEKVDRIYNDETYLSKVDWNNIANPRKREMRAAHREWNDDVKPWPLTVPHGEPFPTAVTLEAVEGHIYEHPIFPLWVRNYFVEVSRTIQVPECMAGAFALAALAGCLTKKGEIRLTGTWVETLNLYVVIVAEPSSGKTPTFKQTMAPLFMYHNKMQDQSKLDINNAKAELALKKKEYDHKLKEYGKSPVREMPPEITELQQKIGDLEEKLDPPTFITADSTPEKLEVLLMRNQEHMNVLTDEGNIVFKAMCDRYGNNSNNAVWISGWDGGPLNTDRMNRRVSLRNPLINLGIGVQSDILRGVMAGRTDNEMGDQGLFARFLYCYPPKIIRKLKTSAIDPEVENAYRENMNKLLALPVPQPSKDEVGNEYDNIPRLCFSDEAAEKSFTSFHDRVQEDLAKEHDREMRQWLGKLASNVGRIIAILHLAECVEHFTRGDTQEGGNTPGNLHEIWRLPISNQTVQAGIRLGYFFLSHARVAIEEMHNDPVREDAIKFVEWLQATATAQFTRAEVASRLHLTGKRADEVLTFLIDWDYIRIVDDAPTTRIDSRTATFDVNPNVLSKDFATPDESENPA